MSKSPAHFSIAVLGALLCSSAFGEYRAYQYVVVNKIPFEDQIKSSIVVSTLDPRTYISYHGGSRLVNVDLLRTWICPGYTGKRGICPSPYGNIPEEILP